MKSPDNDAASPIGAAERLPDGQIVHGYRVVRHLGSGRKAEVYTVADTGTELHYALKLIHRRYAADQGFVNRFREIAQQLKGLRHEHIVKVLDFHASSECCYLVMEPIKGEDLGTHLRRTGGALGEDVARHIYGQIGEALAEAHRQGVLHGGLNPGHVFLCSHESGPRFVKVTDFGLGPLFQDWLHRPPQQAVPSLTLPANLAAYLSPEQARQERGESVPIDAASDQFTLAAMIYEMLIGRPAFFHLGDDVDKVLHRLIKEDPVLFDLGRRRERALMRALSRAPEQRFPQVGDFLKAFDEDAPPSMQLPLTMMAPGTIGAETLTPGRVSRWPWRWLGTAAGVVVCGGALWAALRHPAPSKIKAGVPPPAPVARSVPAPPPEVTVPPVPEVAVVPAPAPEETPPPPVPVSERRPRAPAVHRPPGVPISINAVPRLADKQAAALRACCEQHLRQLKTYKLMFTATRGLPPRLDSRSPAAALHNDRFGTCLRQKVGDLPANGSIVVTR